MEEAIIFISAYDIDVNVFFVLGGNVFDHNVVDYNNIVDENSFIICTAFIYLLEGFLDHTAYGFCNCVHPPFVIEEDTSRSKWNVICGV